MLSRAVGEGGGVVKLGKGGQIYGRENNGREPDFRMWACHRGHKYWIVMLFTWNLYHVINQTP